MVKKTDNASVVRKEYFQLWRRVKKTPAKSLGSFIRIGRLSTVHGLPYLASDGSASGWYSLPRIVLISDTTGVLPGDLLVRGRRTKELIYRVQTVALNIYGETARCYPWILRLYPLQLTVPWTRLYDASESPQRIRRSYDDDEGGLV